MTRQQPARGDRGRPGIDYDERMKPCLGVVALLLVGACNGADAPGDVDASGPAADADPLAPDAARASFATCRGRAFTPAPDESWRHTTLTPITTAAGDPNHSAQDVLVRPGDAVELPGKFTYGTISKDLEDEDVRVSVDDCAGWVDLGDHATNSDGRISVDVPQALGPGVYEAR